MAIKLRYRNGITSRLGVALIGLTVLVMGIAVYAVWQKTAPTTTTPFAITADDTVIVKESAPSVIRVYADSDDMQTPIRWTLSADEGIVATLQKNESKAGEEVRLDLAVSRTSDAAVQLIATQGEVRAEKTIRIRILHSTTNTNTSSNTNVAVNTNTPVGANHLRFLNKDLNMTVVYPITWGAIEYPELVKLKPVKGNIIFARFENVQRADTAGLVTLTAATDDYEATTTVGTPFYFSEKVDTTLPLDRITQQVEAAGFKPFAIEVVTLDGRKVVKMYHMRTYGKYFLEVSYVYTYPDNDKVDTLFLSRSVDTISDFSITEAEAFEKGKESLTKLREGTLASDALRFFREFEDTVATFQFLQ